LTKHIKKFIASLALLSVELLVVLVLFLVAFFVFLFVAFRIFYFKKEAFDFAVFDYLEQFVSSGMTSFMQFITYLGTHYFLIPANLVLIIYFLFIKRHRWYSIRVPVIALGGLLLMFLLKFLFNRPRPLIPLVEEARGLSFPSGHALMSFSFYGLLIYLVWQHVEKVWVRNLLAVLLLLLILLIGFSRIYLRVHYASDVMAGFCMGVIWLVLALWVTRRIETYSRKEIEPEIKAEPTTPETATS
jgi:membrane-associated phospholipid phosphatase